MNDNLMVGSGVVVPGGVPSDQVAPVAAEHKKWLYAVIGVLGVATLVFAGLFIWAMLRGSGGKDEVASNGNGSGAIEQDKNVLEKDKNIQAVLAEAQEDADVRKLVSEIKAQIKEQIAPYNNFSNFYDSGELFYQPEGFVTAIKLNKSYGFSVGTDSEGTELAKKLQGVNVGRMLEERGFAVFGTNYTTASAWAAAMTTYENKQDGIVCETSVSDMYLALNCGAMTWYDKADAELSNALAKAYKEGTGEDAKLMAATTSAIQDGGMQPYQVVTAFMDGSGAMFYRVSPEAEWVFFDRGQAAPNCSQYNTEDLKKAFLGRTCYTEEHGFDSKVEL